MFAARASLTLLAVAVALCAVTSRTVDAASSVAHRNQDGTFALERLGDDSVASSLYPVIAAAHGDPSLHFTPTCVDTSDCTAQLQAALDNTSAPVVRLTAVGSPWITTPLVLRRSDVAIVVEEGAVLLAKRWAFNGTRDSLFTVWESQNVYITGGGSFRMWRSDYANPKWYKHAQWRMTLRLGGVTNAFVRDVSFEHSGGDGVIVCANEDERIPSVNVTLLDVRSRFNYRQGMSVISVQGLTAVNTVFEGTKGTPPMAGVDLEPDHWSEPITGVRFLNCTFRNNTGAGIQVWPREHNNRSLPYDITVDGATFDGNLWGIYLAAPNDPPVGAHLEFTNMWINGSRHQGIACLQHPSAMQRVLRFTNVTIAAAAAGHLRLSPLHLDAACNNTVFENFAVEATAEPTGRPFASFSGLGAGMPTLFERGVFGQFVVRGPNAGACRTWPADVGPTVNVTCDAG